MRIHQNSILLLLSSILLLLCLFTTCSNAIVNSPSPSEEAKVYIVYTKRPQDGIDLASFYVKSLTSVLGSEEAAKRAIIYVYKYVVCGFSAKLTPHQVVELSKKPDVLTIVPNQIVELDPGPGNGNV